MTEEELKEIELSCMGGVPYVRGPDEGGVEVSAFWAQQACEDLEKLVTEVRRLRGLLRPFYPEDVKVR